MQEALYQRDLAYLQSLQEWYDAWVAFVRASRGGGEDKDLDALYRQAQDNEFVGTCDEFLAALYAFRDAHRDVTDIGELIDLALEEMKSGDFSLYGVRFIYVGGQWVDLLHVLQLASIADDWGSTAAQVAGFVNEVG